MNWNFPLVPEMSKLRGYLSFLGNRERPSQSYKKYTIKFIMVWDYSYDNLSYKKFPNLQYMFQSSLTSIFCDDGRDDMNSLMACSLSSSCLVEAVPFFGFISDSSSVIWLYIAHFIRWGGTWVDLYVQNLCYRAHHSQVNTLVPKILKARRA